MRAEIFAIFAKSPEAILALQICLAYFFSKEIESIIHRTRIQSRLYGFNESLFSLLAKQTKLIEHKPVKDDNPCAKRADGKYAIRDVALYLVCKDHKASEGSCDKGQIFTPSNSKCVPIGQVTMSKLSFKISFKSIYFRK